MIKIDMKNQIAQEGSEEHELTTRSKITKNGQTRTRLIFKDSAGFIRTVNDNTQELNVNEGIKGFSWLSVVPKDEFEPIYNQLKELYNKYGALSNGDLTDEELEKKVLKERAKLQKLEALLKLAMK